MRDHVLVYINGRPVEARGAAAFLSLSDFLRRERGLTGTKVVCAEGDCGACAVLLGRLNAAGNRLEYSAVNSCILRMFQLDATHIVTIEGLAENGTPNPIQEAMVACHGAQCGFCTPGMVVGIFDLMQSGGKVTEETVRRGLVGNLCRCTGYDSIIHAAMQTDRAKLKRVDQLYPPRGMIEALAAAEGQAVSVPAGASRYFKPVGLAEALRFRAENPGCLIVAGATDFGVQCNKGTRQIGVVMAASGLKELAGISIADGVITVGATATLTQLERFTVECLPELSRFLAWFGSPLIKNSGTLAGNVVNASPIADSVPAMFVLDAEIEITSAAGGSRWVNIHQFYKGYRQTILAGAELVTRVRWAVPKEGDVFKLYKVSRRLDLDIATFGAAVWMRRIGTIIEDVRIAYGGVGPTVMRMVKTEAMLRGKAATLELFEQAGGCAGEEVSPITDVRGSKDYRRALAENILVKFWYDLGENVPEMSMA
jgi:xanthine dehydrogenase small subunit